MARNVVERIFGTLKRRFNLMVASPEYSESKQAMFIPALCVLHNFISVYDQDPTDMPDVQQQQRPLGTGVPGCPRPAWVSEEEELSASVRRNKIAKEMWAGYQQCLKDRGLIPRV